MSTFKRNFYQLIFRKQQMTNKREEFSIKLIYAKSRRYRLVVSRCSAYLSREISVTTRRFSSSVRREGATIKALGKRWPGPRTEWARAAPFSDWPLFRNDPLGVVVFAALQAVPERRPPERTYILKSKVLSLERSFFLAQCALGHPVSLPERNNSGKGLLSISRTRI